MHFLLKVENPLSFNFAKGPFESTTHTDRASTTTTSSRGCLKQSFLLGSLISGGAIHDQRRGMELSRPSTTRRIPRRRRERKERRGKGQILGYTSPCRSVSLRHGRLSGCSRNVNPIKIRPCVRIRRSRVHYYCVCASAEGKKLTSHH